MEGTFSPLRVGPRKLNPNIDLQALDACNATMQYSVFTCVLKVSENDPQRSTRLRTPCRWGVQG